MTTRYSTLPTALLLALPTAGIMAQDHVGEAAAEDTVGVQPNVVVIYTDDQVFNAIGYNNPDHSEYKEIAERLQSDLAEWMRAIGDRPWPEVGRGE